MGKPRLVPIPVIRDARGAIAVLQDGPSLPFGVKRVYFLFDLQSGSDRGEHAHRRLEQMIIAVSGSVVVRVTDGTKSYDFSLSSPHQGLYLPPGLWRSLSKFSGGTVILVLASLVYDESDYIRNWEEFLAWKSR